MFAELGARRLEGRIRDLGWTGVLRVQGTDLGYYSSHNRKLLKGFKQNNKVI